MKKKNGKRYFIGAFRDNDDYIKDTCFSDFAQPLPDDGPAESDYLSPKYLQEDDRTLLVSFILLDTADDGQT